MIMFVICNSVVDLQMSIVFYVLLHGVYLILLVLLFNVRLTCLC